MPSKQQRDSIVADQDDAAPSVAPHVTKVQCYPVELNRDLILVALLIRRGKRGWKFEPSQKERFAGGSAE